MARRVDDHVGRYRPQPEEKERQPVGMAEMAAMAPQQEDEQAEETAHAERQRHIEFRTQDIELADELERKQGLGGGEAEDLRRAIDHVAAKRQQEDQDHPGHRQEAEADRRQQIKHDREGARRHEDAELVEHEEGKVRQDEADDHQDHRRPLQPVFHLRHAILICALRICTLRSAARSPSAHSPC